MLTELQRQGIDAAIDMLERRSWSNDQCLAAHLRQLLDASARQAEPIYEIEHEIACSVLWKRVSKDMFDRHPEHKRRVVYAAPTPAAAQAIGGSHESVGTQPVGTVTAHAMSQDERGAFLTYWCEDVPEYMREKWKENVAESLDGGNATDKLQAAHDAWMARAAASQAQTAAARDVPAYIITSIFNRTVPFTYQAFAQNLLTWLAEHPAAEIERIDRDAAKGEERP
jgi:hypothetical protein